MIKLIVASLILILALMGLSELLHMLRLLIIAPKKKAVSFSVVFLDEDYFEEQIDCIISQSLWYGKKLAEYIIAVKPENSIINNEKTVESNYNIVFCEQKGIVPTINKLLKRI